MKLRLAVFACLATLASPAIAGDTEERKNWLPDSEPTEAIIKAEADTETDAENERRCCRLILLLPPPQAASARELNLTIPWKH